MVGQQLTVKRLGQHEWVVTAPGERDIADREGLEEAIGGVFAKGSTLVLDLSETTFVDSVVVSVIAAAARRADEEGHRFIVAAPRGGEPRRVLDLVEASQFVNVADNVRQVFG
jgi:anti-anti-sigma factor